MNIGLEMFGYLGTALVLISMMMNSMVKLRILNLSGSVIGMIYAAFCHTWPVVLLNVGMILIHVVHLVKEHKSKEETQ